jgi:predicted enzyme related to lactoylglutathione lyase
MLKGMATVSYFADDVPAARDWYAELLQQQPYFVRPEEGPPAYVEFRVGDSEDELGIIDSRYSPSGPDSTGTDSTGTGRIGGTIVYWHVDDLAATVERLIALGARQHEPITPRGEDFSTASVVDPFGNILGVMANPHYAALNGGSRAGGRA